MTVIKTQNLTGYIKMKLQSRIKELEQEPRRLDPGIAVLLIANMHLHNQWIPSSVFNSVDYTRMELDKDNKAGEDANLLGELVKTINGGVLNIPKPDIKPVGDCLVQYNMIRGYRPVREAQAEQLNIDAKFNPAKFHYADPRLCPPETVFMTDEYKGTQFDLLFNKYPFTPFHFLLVPERGKMHNQYIGGGNFRFVEAVWQFMEEAKDPALRVAFNSLGAHASVNHMHFQAFFADDKFSLPIEAKLPWILPGAAIMTNLPIKHAVWIAKNSDNPAEALTQLQMFTNRLHEIAKQAETDSSIDSPAYNLYFTNRGIALFPRRHQGQGKYLEILQRITKIEDGKKFTTGYAFMEMLGEIICPNQNGFKSVTPDDINEVYSNLSLPQNPFEGLIRTSI